ncbi:conserved hypothetical protein [Neospora caninum Liverpool]|uniref:PH domain-containing protein n=1 Tax=Neospora caninum (strain Liverpool) TaxID=572307 RepID=F0VIV8_NEOCL|nr:conserved hypothetical protein [Neospora caninum Liverpool]CBZ53669.1 conserved hypothetical protein [Neospora caninum Liverpool]CEL67659.1 TPA: hypothetical protein BN1204_034510 [Neospora caninum Liverpool]|eukprot:XP_003883701.1 conserved hypothetical protein [Neospora caninum Liverpool]
MKHIYVSFYFGASLVVTVLTRALCQVQVGGGSVPETSQALNEQARNNWADGIMKMSFKQEDTEYEAGKQVMRVCGEGHRGLLAMILDSSDADAKILTVGQLSHDKLLIYSGNVVEKEYDVQDIVVPVETVDDKCFAIREKRALATVYCARDMRRRDQWLNYLHESIFCKETGVKGKLPAEPGKEVEEVAVAEEIVPTEEPSGINLHLVLPQPPHPSISDFPNPLADNDPESPNTLNSEGEPKTAQELAATHEAMAEQKEIPLTDERVPKAGYAVHRMGRE